MTTTQEFDAELDVLMRARSRLTNKENWLQLGPNGFQGAAFDAGCINSWVGVFAGCDLDLRLGIMFERLPRLIGGDAARDVYDFNDTHEHADILALLDSAIAQRTQELQQETA